MRKTIIIAILLISVLFLAACKGQEKTTTSGFIGGKEGLKGTLVVESSSGGNKVFDRNNDLFRINLNLENKGEDSVEANEVLVSLSGVNLDAFQITTPTKSNSLPLLGRKREGGKVTDPTQTIVQYEANYKPVVEAETKANLVADFCYKYQTISRATDFCLKNKVLGPSGTNPVCKIDEAKKPESSGSPVQVKELTERPAGEHKVNVFLVAENIAKGTIYQQDYLSKGKCVDSDAEKNKVHVKVELTDYPDKSASMIKCSGLNGNEGTVNVIQNKLQLSCEVDTTTITQETPFKTTLRVNFDYVYKDAVSTTLTIAPSI